ACRWVLWRAGRGRARATWCAEPRARCAATSAGAAPTETELPSHGTAPRRVFRASPPKELIVQSLTFSALPAALVDATRAAGLDSGAAVGPEDDGSSFPVRCCLTDEHAAGEVLLLSVQMPAADSPYTAPSPVYIHRGPCSGREPSAAVPEILRSRRLSLR